MSSELPDCKDFLVACVRKMRRNVTTRAYQHVYSGVHLNDIKTVVLEFYTEGNYLDTLCGLIVAGEAVVTAKVVTEKGLRLSIITTETVRVCMCQTRRSLLDNYCVIRDGGPVFAQKFIKEEGAVQLMSLKLYLTGDIMPELVNRLLRIRQKQTSNNSSSNRVAKKPVLSLGEQILLELHEAKASHK